MTAVGSLALIVLGVALYGLLVTALQPPDRSRNRRIAVVVVGAAIANGVATLLSWRGNDFFALTISALSAVVLILLGNMLARAR